MSDLSTRYETDYPAWARQHIDLLRAGRYADIDLPHLLEELSDEGRSERRELESRLLILLAQLLKWAYQYPAPAERWREFVGRSWRATIVEQRVQLSLLLRRSPGLKPTLAEAIAVVYPDAVELASKEARLPPETFPVVCPYRAEQLLDDDFYPEARDA